MNIKNIDLKLIKILRRAFRPGLEGQYIIKNVAIIALAIGVAAQTSPIRKK